tara:strand:+ start:3818 stop:4609 length:792 start_codon:yes stop_codon:yes gene_type:complete
MIRNVSTREEYSPPCRMPNGLQWYKDHLYVMDQQTDQVYVLNTEGYVVRTLKTPTENGSGITVGGGFLWTASNGGPSQFREKRPTDTDIGWIYQLDLETGDFVNRFRTPDGGGIHGIEWDDGKLWVTAFSPKAIILCDPFDLVVNKTTDKIINKQNGKILGSEMKVIKKIEVNTERLHGLARDGDGIWCAHTSDKIIIKYNVKDGKEMERLVFSEKNPGDAPAPHGLSIKDDQLWYCDAMMVGGGHVDPVRHGPEIGIIKLNS